MTSPFLFDEFELDCDPFELRRNGRTLKLERIPMELLILLLERQGSVVTLSDQLKTGQRERPGQSCFTPPHPLAAS
jgi:DNA-binding winged helix-turn-helix (wHTH) protein